MTHAATTLCTFSSLIYAHHRPRTLSLELTGSVKRHAFTLLSLPSYTTPHHQLRLLKADEQNGLSRILSIRQQQFGNRTLLWSHFTLTI